MKQLPDVELEFARRHKESKGQLVLQWVTEKDKIGVVSGLSWNDFGHLCIFWEA